jgi:ABC-type phosphate transport system substrate-binding protein
MFLRSLSGAAIFLASVVGANAADISGAGATFPFPLYAKWAETYKKDTGNGLNYQAIGSGGGIKAIQAKTVTFGASDIPQTAEIQAKSGLVQWPMVMGGIVAVVNIDGVKSGDLVIDGQTLADIYLGKITSWDDAALKKLNPDALAPTARALRSTSPTTSIKSRRNGTTKSARAKARNGRQASAPRAMTASPVRSAKPRARSAMSNTPTPSSRS